MLRVTIDLWPGDDESRKRPLGTMDIALRLDCTGVLGNYDATIYKSPEYAKRPGVWKRGEVLHFPRTSKLCGPWELLALALQSCVGDRVGRITKPESEASA